MHRRTSVFLIALALLLCGPIQAQDPLSHRFVEVSIDSGDVVNPSHERATIFSETVRVEEAGWIRLFFSEIELGQIAGRQDASVLRLTSTEDGAVQTHTVETLEQWRNSSAFFNGNEVTIELIADPDTPPGRVTVTEVMIGDAGEGGNKSICGAVDDRTLSFDDRDARIVPVGCSAWLINDTEGCFLTAGHCVGGSFSVVEFNVPLSDPDGSINHPGPEDQYPIDPASIQSTNTGIGSDYAYFGAFPNTQTELTPIEVQGVFYELGMPPASPSGETVRITGYGSTSGNQGTPLTWDLVQKTHTGTLTNTGGTVLSYTVDTTGGNSGSAVVDEVSGLAIGIHTNAGCSAGGGANNGTGLDNPGLQNILANPMGVCSDGPPPLRVLLTSPIADPIPLNGTSFQLDIIDRSGAPAAINSATLIYDAGDGDMMVPLASLGDAAYEATLPAMACGSEVTFRVDVESAGGSTVHHPFSPNNSVDRRYRRHVAGAHDTAFRDTFETDQGWTVDDDEELTAGTWGRGFPSGFGLRGDPPWDADSSGQCFVTDPAGGNTDVDNGATRLISPTMDGSVGSDPHITYWRWWDDGGPGSASDDTFLVEISNDDGGSWTTLEMIGPEVDGAWVFQSFRVADFVAPTDQIKLRFTASDVGEGGVVEAAVDGVALYNTATGLSCSTIFTDGFESGDTSAWQ